jgi:hypothetical protein
VPIVNGYTDLATLKSRLSIADTMDDAELEQIVTAVSRAIDDYTHRRFYVVTETRVYAALSPERVKVDDFVAVVSLRTDSDGDGSYETLWDPADYWTEPANAALESQPRPYYLLVARPHRPLRFPLGPRRVELRASFGFAASPPAVIREACILQTYRLARRKEAVFGVLDNPEFGGARVVTLDPDVKQLLAGVTLRRGG